MAKKRKATPRKARPRKARPKAGGRAEEQESGAPPAAGLLRLPRQLRAVPLGTLTTDFSSATFATIPSLAAVTSRPTQSLITAKTGVQTGPGLRVLGPGSRVAVRVLRF